MRDRQVVCRTAAGHDGTGMKVYGPAGGRGSGGGIVARVVLVGAQLAQS